MCVCVCVHPCRRSSEGGSKKVALKLSVPEAKVVASSLEEEEEEEAEGMEDGAERKGGKAVKDERLNRLELLLCLQFVDPTISVPGN